MTDEEYRAHAMTQFLRYVDQYEFTDVCWNWTGPLSHDNRYGMFYFDSEQYVAHRFGYVLFCGIFDQSLEIDHLCRNTVCVNPYHLEAVTKEENARRNGIWFKHNLPAQCKRGHDYTEENTRVRIRSGHIYRSCRICERLRKKTGRVLGKESAARRRRYAERVLDDPNYRAQQSADQKARRYRAKDKDYINSLTDVEALELLLKLKKSN